MRTKLLAVLLLTCAGHSIHAQDRPTASRAGDLQVGVSYTTGNSDYVQDRIRGAGFYADFDFREHFGVEFDLHQLDDPQSIVYERTYELGGRYLLHPRRFDRITPYAKAMYGRGVFNFPPPYPPPFPQNEPAANLAYNLVALGGGVDIKIIPHINARVDYEYQRWFSFPPNGLTPQLVTFGVAYHFPPGKPH